MWGLRIIYDGLNIKKYNEKFRELVRKINFIKK